MESLKAHENLRLRLLPNQNGSPFSLLEPNAQFDRMGLAVPVLRLEERHGDEPAEFHHEQRGVRLPHQTDDH